MSARRTIQVLELLAQSGGLGVRAIAGTLNLPVGSVHRLLTDLAQEQVIERDAEGAWRLGHRLLGIVDQQLESLGFQRLARPYCEAIAADLGETVNVHVLSGDGCVVIDKVRGGSDRMQLDWAVGARGPLHCGGSAKAILAYLPEPERVRIVRLPKERFTKNTIITTSGLLAEIARIRERGYAVDDQEVVMGVSCVAVPILDRIERPVGAISISGPSMKMPGKQLMPLVARLNEACGFVSHRLGYCGVWPPAVQDQHVN